MGDTKEPASISTAIKSGSSVANPVGDMVAATTVGALTNWWSA